MKDLKQQLINIINVPDLVRKETHPEWDGTEQQKLSCPLASTRHESGDDSSPSLSINPETGEFNCFGCGWHGTSILGYYTDVTCDGNFKKALGKLFHEYIREVISTSEVKQYHNALIKKPNLIQKIGATRGWTEETIKRLKIGWDSSTKRTTIPIFNLQGYCIDLKKHDTLYRANRDSSNKRIPVIGLKGSRTGDFFPLSPRINPFSSNEIWLLEGEPDTIIASQDGLNCVTVTGGVNTWSGLPYDQLKYLSGKNVIICFDNDKAGVEGAKALAERISAVGVSSLKCINVPKGNDVSEFFLRYGGSAQQLRQYASQAPYLLKPAKRNVSSLPLSETGKAEYIGKKVKTKVIVSGKHESPKAVPERLTLSCGSSDACSRCPCKVTGEAEYIVNANDPEVLNWLLARDYSTQVKDELSVPRRCPLTAEVSSWQNLESVTLIPSLSTRSSKDEGSYTTRRGFFIGHGIESNQNYEITAIPAVHPKTKESVLLVEKATGTYDSVTEFKLTEEEISYLKDKFAGDPKKIINDIVKMLAYNHTHIYGRPDLHTAVDLCFHSPSNFTFSDVNLPKGSIELLLFGDTRCGKGQVAEGLVKFYDLGAVISGENASFMGLCGGAQKIGDQFNLSWGAFPINNGRLVVVDEFSGLDQSILGRLSRIRSEGVAEINKGGINSKTNANVRAIWISNPRKGREVASFASGVSAIMDLVGANEDVARFDLAVVVQKGEVDIEQINTQHSKHIDSRYTKEDLRKIVLWAWSRKSEHVIFTRECTDYILDSANKLAQLYSSTIPLIQGENARFKVAKVAAAIAARTFSTEDGNFLLVKKEHAKLAVTYLQRFFNKPSMGYREFSQVDINTKTLTDIHLLDEFFKMWPNHMKKLIIDGLLSVSKFGVREMQDWCNTDGNIAKKHIGTLVRCQAIQQQAHGLYIKRPEFIKYLKKMKKGLNK